METSRQKKVAQLIGEELSQILPKMDIFPKTTLVTLTQTNITADLSIAKIYYSVFPESSRATIKQILEDNHSKIRGVLGRQLAKNLRQIPELNFYLDDSLDRVDQIDKELRGKGNNPIL